MRGDIFMPVGKLIAQAGHAFLDAYNSALISHPEAAAAYNRNGNGTKVCLRASSEFKLLRAYDEAQRAGLPCSLIIDQHHVCPPDFNGEPIITALGIGPARRDQINFITKRFSLL